jgi:hypothetical protein
MLLSELIVELYKELQEYGDMHCTFVRPLNSTLCAETDNPEIHVRHDEDKDEFCMKISGH